MWQYASPWVELIARDIHARARVKGPPYDVRAIARTLGYDVRDVTDLGGPLGMLVGKVVAVMSAAPDVEAMTIGHELGHAVANEWGVLDGFPHHYVEAQMDAVAAAVLMPLPDAAILASRGASLGDIARVFSPIPHSWASTRLLQLGIC